MRILLDMDGVLCPFMESALKCGFHTMDEYLSFNKNRPLEYNVAKWLNEMDGKDRGNPWGKDSWFEHLIQRNAVNMGFWRMMKPYPWADDLVELLRGFSSDIRICTKPMSHAECYSQKYEWVCNNFPDLADKMIIISDKYLLAGHKNILIDDYEQTIDIFNCTAAIDKFDGCKAILFPQHWNRLHHIIEPAAKINYIVSQLQLLYPHESETTIA